MSTINAQVYTKSFARKVQKKDVTSEVFMLLISYS
jgi:hypothetical protein